MSSSVWPTISSTEQPNNSQAERLGRLIRPSPSSPKTPADTPASTVSVNRRRSSNSRFASTKSRRCSSSWLVMRLKERDSNPTSSVPVPSATRADISPVRTFSAASMRSAMGVASLPAMVRPIHTAANSNNVPTTAKTRVNSRSNPERRPSNCSYPATAADVCSI